MFIRSIALYAFAPKGEKVSWSSFLGPMCEALVVVKLQFDNDIEGIAGMTVYTEHEFDATVFNACALSAPFYLGERFDNLDAINAAMSHRYIPLKNYAQSLFDIALYDAHAKSMETPIYQMLGASRNKIRAYASSPLLKTIDDYLNWCQKMIDYGYTAIKIHPHCVFSSDLKLVKAINSAFNTHKINWSLDVDACYDYEEALSMGQLLEKTGWEFFEEPMYDGHFDAYCSLQKCLDLDIVPGGNALTNVQLIEYGLRRGCWSRCRFDVTGIGGFSAAQRVLAVSNALRLPAEIQSWGYTLTQAANLQLMLSYPHCNYFEQAMPFKKYEEGMDFGFRPDAQGYIRPSDQPGLGVSLDMHVLEPLTYLYRAFKHSK